MPTTQSTKDLSRGFKSIVLLRSMILILMLVAFMMPSADAFAARSKRAQPDYASRYAAIVIDAGNGQVLMSDNPDKQLHPASLTKMMTLLLAFDAMAARQLSTNDYIRISAKAASQSPSKLGIPAGGRVRVDEAIRAVTVKSANDIAVAIGEALAGSESRFAQRMNARAREIGMSRTHFVNASGLHNPFQVSTARDMAILARYIITTYPAYYKYFGLRSFAFGGQVHANHNKLMNTYDGMDGMKTGYISQAGFNLVASAKHGDRRLIGVVFGGRTAKARNDHMAKILDVAFETPRVPKINPNRLAALPTGRGEIVQAAPTTDVAFLSPEAGVATNLAVVQKSVATAPAKARKAVKTATLPARKPKPTPGASAIETPRPVGARTWAVQIGAYQDRDSTDRALYQAMRKLPAALSHATPVVAPLKSLDSGWMFRARMANLSSSEAARACQVLSGCMILPPEGN